MNGGDWKLWQVALLFLGIVAAWSGIIIAALRVMFTRSFKTIDDKMQEFGKTATACNDLERELFKLKADLPLAYVRREDFIRFDVVINSKLDKLRDLVVEVLRKDNKPC